jgi:hypothetical protein
MWRLTLTTVLAVLVGCGGAAPSKFAGEDAATNVTGQLEQTQEMGDAFGAGAIIQDRKIIYEADVTIVVEDFSRLEADVPVLVKTHGGYLSEVEIDRTHGQYLSGYWVVRIPVDQYDTFVGGLSSLGILETFNQTAQDVTEEYVDLEARIANKKKLEERILELLAKSEGAIKDVLEVERELARVRSEMEQMQGRLRYLQNRTTLTTVTIRGIERHDYVPPQAPSFMGRIELAWENSLVALRNFGEGLAVCVVFLFPWILLLAIVVAPLWCIRRYKRKADVAPQEQDSST